MALNLLVSVILCLFLQASECIRYSEIFPHGEDAGDTLLQRGDNVTTTASLRWTYNIFGVSTNEITIGTNGYADFRVSGEETATRFQIFYADADTRGAGYVSWRETNADSITSVISQVTNSVFPDLAPVNITSAVLVFWVGVGYWNNNADKTNSFELAVATDDRGWTYAIYVYANDRIQWTTGDRAGGMEGLGGDYAEVAIVNPDGTQYPIMGSNSEDILRVHEASNTGLRGLWYWRVDRTERPIAPDAEQCVLGCDTNADCVNRTIGFSCVCRENYVGEDATIGSCMQAGAPALKTTFGVLLSALLLAYLSL